MKRDHFIGAGAVDLPLMDICALDQPGFMPFDLIIATAAGPLRYSMRALAAVASLVSDPTAAVNTTFCCSSAGNGPTTSKPGAVRTLIRNRPNSTSPLATTATTCAGLGCAQSRSCPACQ